MLNLSGLYWDWKANNFRFGLITDKGFKVKRFGADLFAVKAGFCEGFRSIDGGDSWSSMRYIIKYCARPKSEIEAKFGKILGLEEETQENS